MEPLSQTAHGFVPDGALAWILLWAWFGVVLLHGLVRSFFRPDPDAIRPSGPIEG